MVEEGVSKEPRLPIGWLDQCEYLPELAERTEVCRQFHQQVSTLLSEGGIVVVETSFRAKTNESVRAKLSRRLPYYRFIPIADIYGARFVLGEPDVQKALAVILRQFNPPEIYPWGLSSIRDHSDPSIKSYASSLRYRGIHIYVPFSGGEVCNIGEVQLFTPEQWETAKRTRRGYEKRQGRYYSI